MKNSAMNPEKQHSVKEEKEENKLYHLLFIGRISLKEYLNKVKAVNGNNQAF